jgi:HPt (histidine-containing phosphotransfer) domain-containing protein
MDDYLTKPLGIDSLAETLGRWLAMSPRSGLHIIDEVGLLKRLNGNDALAKKIVLMFVEKAPLYISVIEENLADSNYTGVRNQAHRLKGAAVTLGADRLVAAAGTLEELDVINEPGQAGQAMQQLTVEFECLVTALTERGWLA